MVGKNVYELSLVRKRQAITLASRTSIVINNEPVQVDPQLMFQRLSLIATRETHENPALLVKYELCSHPPALFDKSSLQKVANKPALADEIWDLVKHEKTVLPTNVYHVIDGGALLQRVPWPRGYTVAAICKTLCWLCEAKISALYNCLRWLWGRAYNKGSNSSKASRRFIRSSCKLYIPNCDEIEERSIFKQHCEQTEIY